MGEQNKKFHFTEAKLKALPLPTKKKERYHDTKTHGLTVCVTQGGSRSYYLYRKIRGKVLEKQIATMRDMSLENARRKVEEWSGLLARGEDPWTATKVPTFGALFEWFMESHGNKAKDGGARRRLQFKYLQPLARKPADQVTRAELITLHGRLVVDPGAPTANRVLDLVRAVYNRAIDNRSFGLTDNPAARIEKADEGRGRERRLEYREIGPFLEAVDVEPLDDIRDLVMVALFTGARKANVLGMRWDQIDALTQAWAIPDQDFKTGEAHTIPLPKAVQEILARRKVVSRSPWVFPGRRKDGPRSSPYFSFTKILERAGIEGFTFHDLRRTCATYMGEAGVDQYLIKRVLGHAVGDVTGIYNRPGLEARREALEKGIALMLKKAGAS